MYSIYDISGFVDELGTNFTIYEFQNYIDTEASLYLKRLFDDGYSIEIDKIIADLTSENFVIDAVEYSHFNILRSNLLETIRKCEEVIILSNDAD